MIKAMNISYEIGSKLYLNITNKCPCNCTFCIRNNGDGAYGSDPLWLEHQPTAEEVIENLKICSVKCKNSFGIPKMECQIDSNI